MRLAISGMRRCLCAAVLLASCPAPAADLLEIFRLAQSADSTYASARAAWSAAQERLPQGRAGLLPNASVSASTQDNNRRIDFRSGTALGSDQSFNSNSLTLSVTQPLFRLQNAIVYRQALTQVEQADAQLALAAQEVILRTAQAYFDVLLAQDQVAFAEAQKTAIGQQLGQARRNFEVGRAAVTDVHEAQARFDLTAAQEIAARNELELRRRALEQVIDRDPPPLAPLGPGFVLKPPEPFALDPWLGLAAQNNLQVQVARSVLAFSGQEIDRNRAAHLPTLDVFANISNNGTGFGDLGGPGNDTRNRVIGLQLAVPIYSGGATTSRVREAVANEGRARQDLETARRAAVFAARQAFLGITNGTALVRALEAALVSTQSQLSSTRVGQEVGVRTLVDVLNAQQLLFSARRDLAQAKYNFILSQLRLEAAIGELTEADLVVVNQWLDRAVLGDLPAGPAAVASDRAYFPGEPPVSTSASKPAETRAVTAPAALPVPPAPLPVPDASRRLAAPPEPVTAPLPASVAPVDAAAPDTASVSPRNQGAAPPRNVEATPRSGSAPERAPETAPRSQHAPDFTPASDSAGDAARAVSALGAAPRGTTISGTNLESPPE